MPSPCHSSLCVRVTGARVLTGESSPCVCCCGVCVRVCVVGATPKTSLLDSFIALFSREKRAALKSQAARTSEAATLADQVDYVLTAYGPGRITGYQAGGIVRVELPYATAYMHLSGLVRPQLVRAAQPIGLVAANEQGEFVKNFAWGRAVVDPTAEGVETIYGFEGENLAVRTPYGRGHLAAGSRPDGIVQVRLLDGTTVFTTLDQITFEQAQ